MSELEGDAHSAVTDIVTEKVTNSDLPQDLRSSIIAELSRLPEEEFIEELAAQFPDHEDRIRALGKEARMAVEKAGPEYDVDNYRSPDIKGAIRFKPGLVAEELMQEFTFRYIRQEQKDKLYIYEDGIYKDKAETVIKQETRARLGEQHYKASRGRNVADYIKDSGEVTVSADEFKAPDLMIPLQNGVYDLENEELVEYEPDMHFTFKHNASYRPELDNKDVEAFLEDIVDTPSKRRQLKEVAGLALLPSKITDTHPILFGPGGNGKNVYIRLIKRLLGGRSDSSVWHKLDAKRLQDDKHAKAELEGKTFAYFDEFGNATEPRELKSMLGDDTLEVRPMHQEGYTAENRLSTLFTANELPKPKERNIGFFRRWQIIELPYRFTAEDDNHKDRLPEDELVERHMHQEALDAFCTQLLRDVLPEFRNRGKFKAGDTPEETRQKWDEMAAPVFAFLEKFVEQGEVPEGRGSSRTDDFVVKDNLLEVVNWWIKRQHGSEVTKHQLTRALNEAADLDVSTNYRPKSDDVPNEDGRPRCYAGIKFNWSNVQRVQGFSYVLRAHTREAVKKQVENYLDIADTNLEAEALSLIDDREGEVSQVDLIRVMELREPELERIMNSEFIFVDADLQDGGRSVPVLKIDEKAVEDAVDDLEIKQVDGLDVTIQEFVERKVIEGPDAAGASLDSIKSKAQKHGWTEQAVEKAVKQLARDGSIVEQGPGNYREGEVRSR